MVVVFINSVLQCYVCILMTVTYWDLAHVFVRLCLSCYVIKASFESYFIRDQLYSMVHQMQHCAVSVSCCTMFDILGVMAPFGSR